MAVGIVLDTFLVRGVLVPALFHLIGPRVWFPRRVRVEGESSAPSLQAASSGRGR
jgi:RND superfamily putative drug exporter